MTKTINKGKILTLRNLAIREEEPELLATANCLVARKSTSIITTATLIAAVKLIAAIVLTVVVVTVVIISPTFLQFYKRIA